MVILPAIDLKDCKVVRLYKGDFQTLHQVADDPVATAKVFYDSGARYMHMVDLDGAKDGIRKNGAVVKSIIEQSGMMVELGGGIRTMGDLQAVFELGVSRAVIGSAAVGNPEFVKRAVDTYGERIAVGIDAHNNKVKTAGWIEDSGLDYLEFAKSMEKLGVKNIIFTDIETDGMLSGPSYERLERLQQAVSCNLIASGGVSCNADIVKLQQMGLYGAIIGKAYYAGTIDLSQAVQDAGSQAY